MNAQTGISKKEDTVSLHDAYAANYDEQISAYGCYLADALFGLCFDYVRPVERILDLGVGSGLSAIPFAKAGLHVHGMDFSPAMLELCRAKGIAVELKLHDLEEIPWPYLDDDFDHLVCCGVFHFLPGLEIVFSEANRVLRDGGIFAYTTKAPSASNSDPRKYDQQTVNDLSIFAHHSEYLQQLLEYFQFKYLKKLKCFVGEDIFHLWITKKM